MVTRGGLLFRLLCWDGFGFRFVFVICVIVVVSCCGFICVAGYLVCLLYCLRLRYFVVGLIVLVRKIL